MKSYPKNVYSYAKKFSKTNSELATFEKEGGELTNDPVEQAEILLEQYKSVESEPKDDCTVNQNFFFESEKCSDCCDEKVHECNEDK